LVQTGCLLRRPQFKPTKRDDSSEPDYGGESVAIFQYLTCPALQFLHISNLNLFLSTLHGFITRSSPPLRTLSATASNQKLEDWQLCLSCVATTLENLEVHSPGLHFQRYLFGRGSNSSSSDLLPRLRTLHLINTVGIDAYAMINFLSSRSTTPTLANIQSFRIICASECKVSVPDDLAVQLSRITGDDGWGPKMDIQIPTTETIRIKHVNCVPANGPFEFVPSFHDT
jgi:hypothetical protein